MKLPSPSFDVIVPTLRGGDDLDACLTGVLSQTVPARRVLVVDDGSTRTDLASRCGTRGVELVINDGRRGFAGACNRGARGSRASWLVFLNDDARPEPTWLAELAAGADRWPDAAFLCPLCLSSDGRIDGAGDELTWTGRPLRRGFGEAPDGMGWGEGPLLVGNATATAWSRPMFEALGGFDEELEMIYDDTDLSLRMSLAGRVGVFLPRSRVIHDSGTTRRARPARSIRLEARNLCLVPLKSLPATTLMRMLPWHLAHAAWAALVNLARGSFSPWARGKLDALLALRRILGQRRRGLAVRRLSPATLESMISERWHLDAPARIGARLATSPIRR